MDHGRAGCSAMYKRRSMCDEGDEEEDVPLGGHLIGGHASIGPPGVPTTTGVRRKLKLRRATAGGEAKDTTVLERVLLHDRGNTSPVMFFPSSPGCDALAVPRPVARRAACPPPSEMQMPEMPSVLAGIAMFKRPGAGLGKATRTSLHMQHKSAHGVAEPSVPLSTREDASVDVTAAHADPTQLGGLGVGLGLGLPTSAGAEGSAPTGRPRLSIDVPAPSSLSSSGQLLTRPARKIKLSPKNKGGPGGGSMGASLKLPLSKMIEKTPPCAPLSPHEVRAAVEHAKELFSTYPRSRVVRDLKVCIKGGAVDLPADLYTRPYTGPGALRQWVPPPLPPCLLPLCKASFRSLMPPAGTVDTLCPLCTSPTNSSPGYVPPGFQLDVYRSSTSVNSSRLTSMSSRCDSINSSSCDRDAGDAGGTSPPMPAISVEAPSGPAAVVVAATAATQ